MPARNLYHDAVVDALTADGWTITDPLTLAVGRYWLHVGFAATRNGERIIVDVLDLDADLSEQHLCAAVGKFTMHRAVAEHFCPGRPVYAAVIGSAYDRMLTDPLGRTAFVATRTRLLVFDPAEPRAVRWIS